MFTGRPVGSYAGLHFSHSTRQDLTDYMVDNHIPNRLHSSKLHSTVLYSRKYLPDYEPAGELETPFIGKFKKFDIFPSQPDVDDNTTKCLVLVYECKEQIERFNFLMKEYDASFDFDEYIPHITLSYDVGNLDVSLLPPFTKDIEIIEEYKRRLFTRS